MRLKCWPVEIPCAINGGEGDTGKAGFEKKLCGYRTIGELMEIRSRRWKDTGIAVRLDGSVRATILVAIAAALVALMPAFQARAQDKPKADVVTQIGHSTTDVGNVTSAAAMPWSDKRVSLPPSHDP